jgi:hypothetical protein
MCSTVRHAAAATVAMAVVLAACGMPSDSTPTAAPLAGIRTRLLAWFVILLALGTATSVLVVRQILLHRLNERIGRELVQEVRELRFLARGNDPETGEAFRGRVGRIFEVFLERNIPARNEAIVTFVDGEPFLRSRPVVPYRLDQDPGDGEQAAARPRWTRFTG